MRDQWLETLQPLCGDVEEDIIRDFVSRMDEDYFTRFAPADIAAHVRLAARLDPDHPCQTAISERSGSLFDVVVVAYDYFSEFGVICGLLSAFGLDIREGSIDTSADAPPRPSSTARGAGPARRRPGQRPGLSRKKIVDHFLVRAMPGASFAPHTQQRFADELDRTIRLLDAGRFQEARSRVNLRLVETLSSRRGAFTGLLNPVHIRFDNQAAPSDTLMDIRSTDTPAFLYAFANALAMRGLYVRKALFKNVGSELHDRFYVRGRRGHKIDDPVEQQELTATATLIKQFTHFLTWAPDPAKAMEHFDLFLDRILEEARSGTSLKFLKERNTMTLLAQLLGTSDFLWEDFLRRQHANLLPLLDTYGRGPLLRPRAALTRELRTRMAAAKGTEARRRALNQYKDEELFRIDMKHLSDPATGLPEFSRALTGLAEVVLEQAAADCLAELVRLHGRPRLAKSKPIAGGRPIAGGQPCPYALFGMGKFGGQELGYASDIEILFVYGGDGRTDGRQPLDNSEFFERLMQELLKSIEAKQEGIFHLDVRLRPHGGKGLLANTLDELRSYYSPSGLSAPFERQALIKLRFVAGSRPLGAAVEAHRNAFVYSGEPWKLDEALDLRRRQIKELVEPGQVNVKYSPGGLIDVEYAVQYLQLMHGRTVPALRTPNTLAALSALGKKRLLASEEAAWLREAYLFLRNLIDALRIVRGNAKDLVLPPRESEAFIFLARRLGYAAERWEEGAMRLAGDIDRNMTQTRRLFERRFGRL
jgi:glutamate-ammonia-ligase adenylyltransferase